jgi:glucose-6-phosphate 1-dehydrogenase
MTSATGRQATDSGEPQPAPNPTVFVLFGATGDLAKRMVLPAFFQLHRRGLAPAEWLLIGNGRGDVAHEEFRSRARESLEQFGPGKDNIDPDVWEEFAARLRFAGGGFDENDPGSLLDVIDEAHQHLSTRAQYVHYLAIPPAAFETITKGLGAHHLLDDARVVYEKPYGTSLETFNELDRLVHSAMNEDQVYRIDHFLGKEATQNLHVLRFGNAMIQRIWNADAVAEVQIDVPETLDVANRARFYDQTGAFRDMIATHLFQVAAEVAMERPESMNADDLQTARESVLSSFRPLDPSEVVFGQYAGYTDLPEVDDHSTTDTLAAVRLWVDSERWHGVPFLLRSGKQLADSKQLVTLIMRQPTSPFTDLPDDACRLEISLSGPGQLQMTLVLKRPGPQLALAEQRIDLGLGDLPGSDPLPPYVALLHDITIGDRSLFTSSNGLSHAWRAAEPVLNARPAPIPYQPGSWGPSEADNLTQGYGWLTEQG